MASTSKVEARLRPALESVASKSDQLGRLAAPRGREPEPAWVGCREHGLQGNTVGALADRGLVEVKVAKKPYERLVCRLTPAGREALEQS